MFPKLSHWKLPNTYHLLDLTLYVDFSCVPMINPVITGPLNRPSNKSDLLSTSSRKTGEITVKYGQRAFNKT